MQKALSRFRSAGFCNNGFFIFFTASVLSFCLLPRGGQEGQVHEFKIDVSPIDLEKSRNGTQPVKAVFFVQPNGAGIIAAHLQIDLLEAVFPGEGKDRFHQGGGGAAGPTMPFLH